jgi:hypothetical protein
MFWIDHPPQNLTPILVFCCATRLNVCARIGAVRVDASFVSILWQAPRDGPSLSAKSDVGSEIQLVAMFLIVFALVHGTMRLLDIAADNARGLIAVRGCMRMC